MSEMEVESLWVPRRLDEVFRGRSVVADAVSKPDESSPSTSLVYKILTLLEEHGVSMLDHRVSTVPSAAAEPKPACNGWWWISRFISSQPHTASQDRADDVALLRYTRARAEKEHVRIQRAIEATPRNPRGRRRHNTTARQLQPAPFTPVPMSSTMKTLGLLGGMSWESTVTYYQTINRRVRQVRGGLHSAPCVIWSVDFGAIEQLQHAGRWDEAGQILDGAAASLARAGADALVLCTNTMHFVSRGLESASGLPLIHIVDPTARGVVAAGFRCVGLLGTRFTMEKGFYAGRLREGFGLEVVVPGKEGREVVHRVIYEELCNGVVREESRQKYRDIIEGLKRDGAECLIFGCTEIGLLLDEEDCVLPVFDTTRIHAVAAADWAMGVD